MKSPSFMIPSSQPFVPQYPFHLRRNVGFSGTSGEEKPKPYKKTKLDPEQLAARRALEESAPGIWAALPAVFKLSFPLPVNAGGVVKYGHIEKLIKAMSASKICTDSPRLQAFLEQLRTTGKMPELQVAEETYLSELRRLTATLANPAHYFTHAHLPGLLLDSLPKGPFKDSIIAHLIRNAHQYLRIPAMRELPNMSNTAMRQSLEVMVQNVADYESVRHLSQGITLPALPRALPLEGEAPTGFEELAKFSMVLARAEEQPATGNSDKIPLSPLLHKALEPFTNCGFSLLEAEYLIGLLKETGKDEGALISEVLPAYQRFVEFAVSKADKFVPAGEPVPSEIQIRAKLQHEGIRLMETIVLAGEAPLNNALDMKRLSLLLEKVPQIIYHQSYLIRPLAAVSRLTEDPYDCIKLMELLSNFSRVRDSSGDVVACLEKMIAEGKPDVKALGKLYLKNILGREVLQDVKIVDEQLDKWNLKYIHTFSAALGLVGQPYRTQLIDIAKAALEGRFKTFLHDPSHLVGKNNLRTKRAFDRTFSRQNIKLDYDQWLNYQGKEVFVRPGRQEMTQKLCRDGAKLLTKMMAHSEANRAGISKLLLGHSMAIQEGTLVTTSDRPLTPERLYNLFDIYPRNKFQSEFVSAALEILKRINRLNGYSMVGQDLKIELWKREPGHDLFLGNYTGACIALDNPNGKGCASIQANQNTFVQVAYLKNADSDRVAGKALFYMAKDLRTQRPIMVLNTYEARENDREGNYEECPTIREHLVKFAKDYSRAVVGYAVPLYTGSMLNPIYADDLKPSYVKMQVVGSALGNEYYLDSLRNDGAAIAGTHRNDRLMLLDAGDPVTEKQSIWQSLRNGLHYLEEIVFGPWEDKYRY